MTVIAAIEKPIPLFLSFESYAILSLCQLFIFSSRIAKATSKNKPLLQKCKGGFVMTQQKRYRSSVLP